jgi:hypothetical protein
MPLEIVSPDSGCRQVQYLCELGRRNVLESPWAKFADDDRGLPLAEKTAISNHKRPLLTGRSASRRRHNLTWQDAVHQLPLTDSGPPASRGTGAGANPEQTANQRLSPDDTGQHERPAQTA